MELDIPRQQKVPRLVTGLSQRRLTRGNFIKCHKYMNSRTAEML
jgi:hypothetical protein